SVNTEAGMVLGTTYYMSPEQVRGLEVDARTDIWSLGCVLFEMVSGLVPFEGGTTSDVLAAILTAAPPSLNQFVPGVPLELQSIVGKALHKDREERYEAARELLNDLKVLEHQLEFETESARS